MLMGEERAAMVFTDPPYNVPIDGHASGLGAIHHRSFPMASGEMDRNEYTTFLLSRPLRCQAAGLTVHGAWLSLALRHQTEPRRTGGFSPRRCGTDHSWVNTISPVT